MTNQEAIKTLKEADTCFCKHGAFKDCHSRCKYKDALDMAINALTAIEDIKAEIQNVYFFHPSYRGLEMALDVIDKHLGKESE